MEVTTVTIRNVPLEVHRAIRIRAAQNGHSLQAEMWDILNKSVKPDARVKLGDVLQAIGEKAQLTDEEMEVFAGDTSQARAVSFD